MPGETDTLPLPSIISRPAPGRRLVRPTVLRVTLFARVLLLTTVVIPQPLLVTLCVRVTFNVVETSAEVRFVLKRLNPPLSCPRQFVMLLPRCRARKLRKCLATSPRGQVRRFILYIIPLRLRLRARHSVRASLIIFSFGFRRLLSVVIALRRPLWTRWVTLLSR